MYRFSTSLILCVTSGVALASSVITTDPVKAPFDTKKSLFITGAGGYACPDGYDLYVRAVKPEVKKGDKELPGDYESFYFAKTPNPQQPAIIVSRPGISEYIPACIQVK